MLNLQKNSKSSPNVMDFHKILYIYAPCKSELNKKNHRSIMSRSQVMIF